MCRILVIDDEYGILHLIREALTRYGHRVETAANGREGIQKFDEGTFDLVITDILMPLVDGNGVVRHIRQHGRQEIPVIGISGTPWLSKQSDFDLVLAKPFRLQTLVESVAALSCADTRMAASARGGHA
jgi:two-component system response regulator VanR